ncbi:MAG: hypothetical protein HZA50_00380 [Planctomycetes bacterium]|nr:hypothetical protein [Planctomycetota bacterium]
MKMSFYVAAAASTFALTYISLLGQTSPAVQSQPAEILTTRPAASDKTQTRILKTLGAMAAAHLYEAYLSIGMIADGKEQEIYETKEAQAILDTTDSLLAGIDKQMDDLLTCEDLGKKDRETLTKVKSINTLLLKQSSQLQTYWKSGKQEDSSKYDATRQEAWKAISELLGLDK